MAEDLLGAAIVVLCTAAGLGLVVGVTYVQQRLEQRRDLDYAAFCANHNFHYVLSRDGADQEYVAFLPFVAQGSWSKWRHEISGTIEGRVFTAFEYTYTVGSGRATNTYHDAVIRWEDPKAALPRFTLAPESFFSRFGQRVLGSSDIDFEDDSVFSNAYVLDGFNEGELRRLFDPDLRAFLVSHPHQHVAGDGPTLFCWYEQKLPPAASLDAFLANAAGVAQVFFSRHAT